MKRDLKSPKKDLEENSLTELIKNSPQDFIFDFESVIEKPLIN